MLGIRGGSMKVHVSQPVGDPGATRDVTAAESVWAGCITPVTNKNDLLTLQQLHGAFMAEPVRLAAVLYISTDLFWIAHHAASQELEQMDNRAAHLVGPVPSQGRCG